MTAHVPTVFLSCDSPQHVAPLAAALVGAGACVLQSPSSADDPSWKNWYGPQLATYRENSGCRDAIAQADVFVAVVWDGYDSSTWMGIEADVAMILHAQTGAPKMFVWHITSRPLALGFKDFANAARALPADVASAAALIVAG